MSIFLSNPWCLVVRWPKLSNHLPDKFGPAHREICCSEKSEKKMLISEWILDGFVYIPILLETDKNAVTLFVSLFIVWPRFA